MIKTPCKRQLTSRHASPAPCGGHAQQNDQRIYRIIDTSIRDQNVPESVIPCKEDRLDPVTLDILQLHLDPTKLVPRWARPSRILRTKARNSNTFIRAPLGDFTSLLLPDEEPPSLNHRCNCVKERNPSTYLSSSAPRYRGLSQCVCSTYEVLNAQHVTRYPTRCRPHVDDDYRTPPEQAVDKLPMHSLSHSFLRNASQYVYCD